MDPDKTSIKARLLVAIANHGTKNRHFLDRLLKEYRSMEHYQVDIVVLSNIPKDLGPDIEVRVGAPIEDPWSLPFGYKDLFLERKEDYDLYIYTEDDTLITEKNIDAFVEETRVLPENLIAGFMRYEVAPDGQRFYSSMHSHYHWDARSVKRYGDSLFAYYTNEHAACFILTRDQLKHSIDSGGFTLPARKGRYDMLVTAATDPYTECGMTKVVCISRMEEFCLHHLPNVYCGKLGLDVELGNLEIRKLAVYADPSSAPPAGPLFPPYPLRDGDRWNKKYYESRRDDVLSLVPAGTRSVLSVGCGCGTTEEALVSAGKSVTGIPLDSIVAAVAASKGVETLSPDFALAEKELGSRRFDCILLMDILQQLPDPVATLAKFRGYLNAGGTIIVSTPNWNHHGIIKLRFDAKGRESLECRAGGGKPGVHATTRGTVAKWLKQGGLRGIRHAAMTSPKLQQISRLSLGLAYSFIARNLVMSAKVG